MNVSSDTSGSDSDGLLSADDSISVGSDSDISPSDSSNEDSSELDEREFYLPEHFQENMLSLPQLSSSTCEICGSHFASFEGLKSHQRALHEGIKRKVYSYPCSQCDKVYKENRELKVHVRMVHEGIKDTPFECSFCHKKFGRKASRDVHILLHTGEFKKFDCEDCSASYKTKQNLMIHMEKKHPEKLRVEEN